MTGSAHPARVGRPLSATKLAHFSRCGHPASSFWYASFMTTRVFSLALPILGAGLIVLACTSEAFRALER